jgi:hypothetical protein
MMILIEVILRSVCLLEVFEKLFIDRLGALVGRIERHGQGHGHLQMLVLFASNKTMLLILNTKNLKVCVFFMYFEGCSSLITRLVIFAFFGFSASFFGLTKLEKNHNCKIRRCLKFD